MPEFSGFNVDRCCARCDSKSSVACFRLSAEGSRGKDVNSDWDREASRLCTPYIFSLTSSGLSNDKLES